MNPSQGAARSARFEPAQWLIWAERCGYRIYLSEVASGHRLGIVMEIPNGPRAADDLELWRVFQGEIADRKANRTTLIQHLMKIGRIERRAGPVAVPEKELRVVND
jgi:hypothetical protein